MVVCHCSGIFYSTVIKFKLIQLLRSFFDNLPWYNVLPRDMNYNCGKDTNFVAKLLRWKTMNYITKYFVQTILLQINWRQLNKWMNGYPDICQCLKTAIWLFHIMRVCERFLSCWCQFPLNLIKFHLVMFLSFYRLRRFRMILSLLNPEYHLYCSSKEVAERWVLALTDCGYMSLYRKWKDLQVSTFLKLFINSTYNTYVYYALI